MEILISSIATAHYEINGKRTFSVMGLGNDNQVYRWLKGEGRWELFKSPPYKPKKQQRKDEGAF